MINEKNIPSSQEETARQQSFIQLAKALTEQKIQTLGRPLTYCLTTFGCPKNDV